jgi:hypothetical protein
MGSFGQVSLKTVWAMLDACAPGHTRELHTHHYCIRFQGQTYPTFPKGRHGSSDPLIQVGHVKRMVRFFHISECAKRHLSI